MLKMNGGGTGLVELSATDGVAFVGDGGPLTRLHYFDGQFLRAASLTLEQDYHRSAVRFANLAGGWGVVNGFGISLDRSGARLLVSAGLAITPTGSFAYAGSDLSAAIADLLKVAKAAPRQGKAAFDRCLEAKTPAVPLTPSLAFYEITVGPIEGLCGDEPVYGKLCESACATDSQHPWWREGVVLRLRPVSLALPDSAAVKAVTAHLRNRMASAYFAAEPWLTASLLSRAGLASHVWCEPAVLYGRDEVVIGLLAREGTVVRVYDAWSGRRERMDAQPRGYWQGRMSMRPWNVFLAQILQFQCQLSELLDAGTGVILPADDCDRIRDVLGKARRGVEVLIKRYQESAKDIVLRTDARPTLKQHQALSAEIQASYADLGGLSLALAEAGAGKDALPAQRMLLNAGFFELPPAGYLPVAPDTDVREQVTRMFGEGVHVTFHAVRADEIGHLVEEAQHMERISLTRGLDDPKRVEQVEVFVPDGAVADAKTAAAGTWWRMEMSSLSAVALVALAAGPRDETPVKDAPAPAPAKKARAAKAKAAAPIGFGEASLVEAPYLRVSVPERRGLEGVARTESRDDGTFGLTFVVSFDALQGKQSEVAETGGEGGLRPAAQADATAAAKSRAAIYLGADVAKDPFQLPVGGVAALEGEMRLLLGGAAQASSQDGKLTVLRKSRLPSGVEERLVQLDVRSTAVAADGKETSSRTKVSMVLQRDGDSKDGVFVIDDERQDPKSPPLKIEWDSVPRHAVMYMEAADPRAALQRRMSMMAINVGGLGEKIEVGGVSGAAKEALPQRVELASLDELQAMPLPASDLGASALGALAAIADAGDDTAFLMRSRQRLFPALDAPKTQTVRAVRDWVMFRRARTSFCAPPCRATVEPRIETFQVWHLRMKTADEPQLAALVNALQKGDRDVLDRLDFRRVGVLRYRDESAYSEEPAERVLDMWTAAQPANTTLLGRAWETTPETGQGWQNHMRLKHMLAQISSLTKPPAAGGDLGVVAPPPGRLADASLDGGLLLVTTPQQQPPEPPPPPPPPPPPQTVRTAALVYALMDGGHNFLTSQPRGETKFVDDAPHGTALANYVAQLDANHPVAGVTLATVGQPDAQASVRMEAVAKEVVKTGRPAPRKTTVAITPQEITKLSAIGVDAHDFDEVIIFENR
jgi:hypothetical protein